MKLSELRLDTAYADHDGRALALLSLDKFALPRNGYGTRSIRRADKHDRSWGVAVVRQAYRSRNLPVEGLLDEAKRLRANMPEREQMFVDYEVVVSPLRLVIREWEDHLIAQQMEVRRQAAAAAAKQRARDERTEVISRIKSRLPEGVEIGTGIDRDWVTISHKDLLAILER